MVDAGLAAHFWTAVEDCLITFHDMDPGTAAGKVAGLRQRLPVHVEGEGPSYSDLIFHAEPWHIACNLAGRDLPTGGTQREYQELLRRNGLA